MPYSESLENGIKYGFIDNTVLAEEQYKPTLLLNDITRGEKVLTSIVSELKTCDEFMFSVAFITESGVNILLQVLKELQEKNIKGRIVASQYQNFTQPKALDALRKFSNIELRIISNANMHAKGYIFRHGNEYTSIIGSSNLTQNALCENREWNVKLISTKNGNLIHNVIDEFNTMYEIATPVDQNFLDEYSKIYAAEKRLLRKSYKAYQKEVGLTNLNKINPNKMQLAALENLEALRNTNKNKALLISATGTGKTYLSAFDVKKVNPKKFLFIIHREQIAQAALNSFKRIIGEEHSMAIYSGNHKDANADYLFCTIQTLFKDENLQNFKEDEFDYIVIDEVHRAGADSYQKVIDYFNPKFLLGMTATPERSDDFDIYSIFDHNIAYEIRLQDAMKEKMICPFHYFGITELTIDGKVFDDHTEFNHLVSDQRVNHIIEQSKFYGYCGDRLKCLVFCSRKEEAKTLSKKFNQKGYDTIALCGDDTQESRKKAIARLEQDEIDNKLDYIFTVDIFNEGIDIPAINQIIMLRPTQSAIIFVQQLGRGLRFSNDKEYLVVIDFIGNYKNNFFIPVALSGDRTYNKDTIRKYLFESSKLLPGCSTISFDNVSKERIFKSITATNFSTLKYLKDEYKKMKFRLGHVPTLMDFYTNDAVDPSVILNYAKTYYMFLKTVDNDSCPVINDQEHNILEFVSTQFSSGKRPHEILILKLLIDKTSITLNEVRSILERNYNYASEISLQHALKYLSGHFISGSDAENYSDCKLIDLSNSTISKSLILSQALTNSSFKQQLIDLLDYSLSTYKKNYYFHEPNGLTLYKKYSRKDICWLLNWDKDMSSTVYGYKIHANDCPIFITYNKSEKISSSILYGDKFIDKETIGWKSKNNRTLESNEIKTIINKRDLEKLLFVKKEDGEGQDHYYLGQVDTIPRKYRNEKIKNDNGEELPIVNFELKLKHTVNNDIYEYLTK